MIEKIQDLDLKTGDTDDQVDAKIKEKLGIGLTEMKEALSSAVRDKAEEISLDLMNIAPYGDYDKLIEDNEKMAEFLKQEAHKPENWELFSVQLRETDSLIQFKFMNSAVDQGDTFEGLVYVSQNGKIRHAFAQGEI
jgi:dsDNA-binding SOS-regulon protein